MKLRDYQRKAADAVHAKMRAGNARVVVISPTGSGKTVLAVAGIVQPRVLRGERWGFVVHLREVVDQACSRLEDIGMTPGVIMASRKPNPRADVQVCSIQTLAARKNYPDLDGLIIDECHRSSAPMYRKLVERYPNIPIIGLTATPVRADGKGLGPPHGPFTDKLEVITPSELVRRGNLVPTVVFGADTPDLDKLRVDAKTRDFDQRQAGEIYTKNAKYVGDAVDQWQKHANGLRTVTFCSTRAHAQAVSRAFTQRGIPSAVVDGKTPKRERAKRLEQLKRGELVVLVNVDVFTEGFDEPLLGCVQVLRPTLSLGRWIQMAGRGLRPITDRELRWCREHKVAPPRKPHVIILDHGGNVQRHGFPTDDRHWSLEPQDVSAKAMDQKFARNRERVWRCPACGAVATIEDARCNHCGAVAADVVPRALEANLVRLRDRAG